MNDDTKDSNLKDFDWHTLELESANIKKCDHFGCDQEGLFPAPKNIQNPHDKYLFCLEHVKAYNEHWNYLDEVKRSGGTYDPTKEDPDAPHNPFKSAFSHHAAHAFKNGNTADQINDPHDILGDSGEGLSRRAQASYTSNAPKYFSPKTKEGKAFVTLKLQWPFTEKDLKNTYKKLAKIHHPDLNQQSSILDEFEASYLMLRSGEEYLSLATRGDAAYRALGRVQPHGTFHSPSRETPANRTGLTAMLQRTRLWQNSNILKRAAIVKRWTSRLRARS